MPGPKPTEVKLSAADSQDLAQLIRRHSTPQQIALRARIVVSAAAGLSNAQIVRQEGVSVVMVRRWRDRWATLAPIPREELSAKERLADLPRPGAPARITADQVCRIVALACEDPEDTGRPISQWTSREIADEVKKRDIVKEISPRHAARLLKRRGSQAASDPLLADTLSR
jgi:putative transposase